MYSTNKLRQLRKEKGFTVYDMARLLEITPSFYSQIETKRRRLFYDTALKICHILNMKPDSIFYTQRRD